MSNRPHLSRAPIEEAVIDIRVASAARIEQLDELAAALSTDFLKLENVSPMTALKGHTPSTIGIRLASIRPDLKYIFLPRLDRFSVSKRRPYNSWAEFRAEALRLWTVYSHIIKPTEVLRIGLRYLNVIELNVPVNTFEDLKIYLKNAPCISKDLPQSVGNCGYRFEILNEALNATGVLGVRMDKDQKHMAVDIEAYCSVTKACDDRFIWENFDRLADFKNDIFFETVSSKIINLYE